MIAQRLFGIETEYGLSVVPASGAACGVEDVALKLLTFARTHPHLPGLHSAGIFLANGSRFYVDCGAHPELCTPECANPWDICRYVQAGEQILLQLSGQVKARDRRVARSLIFKGNVDYLARTTWGCHESYLHTETDQGELSRQIIPHLVSRIVFTGAGGWDAFSAGMEFLVSPRVAHLCSVVSGESTGERGIFHTRNESLSGNGYRRLHILCGESLCGETGTWLKIATTALVVALIEARKRPGDAVKLADALGAMRAFAADPSCRCVAKLADRRHVTAVEIQHHFLGQAEAHADADFMPPWAGEACRQWRAMLDRLQNGAPASVAQTLDWAIKQALFENHIRRRGMTTESVAVWTRVLGQLSAALAKSGCAERGITAEMVLSPKSPIAAIRARLTGDLEKQGLRWANLDAVLALRLELFEIDRRFSMLGEDGIFTALDRQGVLDHHFPGVDNIPHAIEYPPAIGRAAVRGGCIRNLAGRKGSYAAEWDGVFDHESGQRLNLSDPLCESANWEAFGGRERRSRLDLELLFRRGLYEEVLRERETSAPSRGTDIECLMFSHARLGQRSEALALLESARRAMDEFHHIALSLSVLSNGLVPARREIETLLRAGDRLKPQLLEGREQCSDYTRFIYLQYKALWLLHEEVYDYAERIMVALLSEDSNRGRTRMYNRTRCNHAELLRKLGRREEALRLVRAAIEEHNTGQFAGDLADHSLPVLAKLSPDAAEAYRCLEEAETIERAHNNRLGLARILCLRARRFSEPGYGEEVELLQRTVPVLSDCPVAKAIVRHWREWAARPATDPVDYWGL